MSKSISARFLSALGLTSIFSAKSSAPDLAAVIAERDEAVSCVQKAHDAYSALEEENKTLISAHAEELTKLKAENFALTSQFEAAQKEKAELEKSMPGKIAAEVARIAAAQGIPGSEVPPANAGGNGTGDTAAELDAALAAMRAEKDPVKKGQLCEKVEALRKRKTAA